jgi:hypothetical protein
MSNTILIKKSSTAAAQPTAGQLSAGELAINTADGRLFAKNSAGTVVNLPVTSISGQAITPASVGATGNVAGSTLTSSVAVGTAPLAVTSTTVCTNLNADTVDGQHASAFAAAQSFTAINANTVTLTAARDAFYRYTVISPVTITLPTASLLNGDIVCILVGTYASGSLTVSGAQTGTDVLSAAGQKVTYQYVSGLGGGWYKLPVDVHTHSAADITTGTVANERLPTGNRLSGYCAGIFFG